MLLILIILLTGNLKNANSRPLPGTKPDPQVNIKVVLQRNHDPETLEELLSKTKGVVEGDILLPSDRNAIGRAWTTQDIPYEISPEMENRTNDILAAMAMVSKHTCVSFHQRNDSETNYLFFKTSRGCASYVGFISGKQPVFAAPSCLVGNIAHEILHSLGFHHEHTRLDREQYINIVEGNIISGMESNFQAYEGKTFDIEYDYKSILHYGSHFFSSNGKPTIIPKKEVLGMGQRRQMTESDIKKVQILYHCDSQKDQNST